MQKRSDMAFEFWQESNFWWLTGLEEPDWVLIIEGNNEWLVRPDSTETSQIFNGSSTLDDIHRITGIDNIITGHEAKGLLDKLAKKHDTVAALGQHPHHKYFDFYQNPTQGLLQRKLKRVFNNIYDCRGDLAKLRAIKQPQEIQAIEQAVDLTVEGFRLISNKLQSYQYEYQIEADFSYFFRSNGASGHAYDPIIAAGKNACTLHYSINNSAIKAQQLLLIDVGAKISGYSADITRTYAISKPTKRQRQIHQAVEDAHHKIIGLLKPGLLIKDYQIQSDSIMKDALKIAGLYSSDSDYRKYFPHAISHGLGVDVHDSLGGFKEFKEGMVLTVEPGIYIPEESIGIRIEDDILITSDGNRNLSAKLPTNLL